MASPLHGSPRDAVTPDEMVSRARALIPGIIERQERTEADRRVSDAFIEEYCDAELHKNLMPARYGGFEMGLDTFADVAFEIARAADRPAGSVRSPIIIRCSYPIIRRKRNTKCGATRPGPDSTKGMYTRYRFSLVS